MTTWYWQQFGIVPDWMGADGEGWQEMSDVDDGGEEVVVESW